MPIQAEALFSRPHVAPIIQPRLAVSNIVAIGPGWTDLRWIGRGGNIQF
jgi:hypothetical protein